MIMEKEMNCNKSNETAPARNDEPAKLKSEAPGPAVDQTPSTEAVGENDVLLGRGGATNSHTGNRKFRQIVARHQQEYLKARKRDKVSIARRIVAIVHSNGGRFLKRTDNAQNWVEVTEKRAQEKTSQALREGLDVRNNTIRPSKQIKEMRPASGQNQQSRQGVQVPEGRAINITIPQFSQFSPNSTVVSQPLMMSGAYLQVPQLKVPHVTQAVLLPSHLAALSAATQKDAKNKHQV